MILLLFAKGTAVFTALETRPRLLPGVFVVMVALGVAIQLLVAAAGKVSKEASDDEEDE